MKTINPNTNAGRCIIEIFRDSNWGYPDIYKAYKTPSAEKVQAYNKILERACRTPGYNHNIRITGANTYSFSTMYSYTDETGTYIVYDTPSDTKVVKAD